MPAQLQYRRGAALSVRQSRWQPSTADDICCQLPLQLCPANKSLWPLHDLCYTARAPKHCLVECQTLSTVPGTMATTLNRQVLSG